MHPVAKIYPWIILAVLFLARMALGYQFQSIASVAPFLVNSLHVNYAEIGSLIGIYMLPGAFVSLPAGLIGRHVGERSFAVTALALMAAGGVIVALSHGYALALAGRLTSGAGNAMLNMVLTKMVTDWFAERGLALAMGILLASWPFAIGTGLIVHNMIASRWGWPVVMYSTAAFCALAMLLVAVVYHAPGGRRRGKPVRKSEAGSASLALPPLNESLPALVSGSIWGTYNIALLVFFSFAPLLLVEHGALRGEAASWVSAALWIGMVSVPLGGFLVQRIGRGTAVISIFCFLSAWIFALLPSGAWPLTLCALLGVTMGPPAGAIMALPARALSIKNRSTGLGLFYTIHYSLAAVGPAIAGYLRDVTGGTTASVIFGAACFLAILPLLMLFERLLKQR
jgi:predicted MFS family arabinose efflux permease